MPRNRSQSARGLSRGPLLDSVLCDVATTVDEMKVRPKEIAAEDALQNIYSMPQGPADDPNQMIRVPLSMDAFKLSVRSVKLEPSYLSDIDGFMAALVGWRVEKDLFAHSQSSSMCEVYGLCPYEWLGSVLGLYLCDIERAPEAVALAVSFDACGVFLVPARRPEHRSRPPFVRRRDGSEVPWYDMLMKHSVLTFDIPASAVSGTKVTGSFMAVLANFDASRTNFVVKSNRRKEKHFELAAWPDCQTKLGICPELRHRMSPLPADQAPSLAKDTVKAAPPFVVPPGLVPPKPAPTLWKMDEVRRLTTDFPDKKVRNRSLAYMEGKYNGFKGSLKKAVVRERPPMSEEKTKILYELYLKLIAKGSMWGPSNYCPFMYAWLYWSDIAPKHKHRPLCTDMRPIANLSTGRPNSPNDLSESERWITCHHSPFRLCDEVVYMYTMAVRMMLTLFVAEGDIPAAFKMNPIPEELLPIFATRLWLGGRWKYFCDQASVFGYVNAESGFQAALALLIWICRKFRVRWYVDNYWYFALGEDIQKFEKEYAVFKELLSSVGVDVHQENPGRQTFKGLGWIYHLAHKGPDGPLMLECEADKKESYRVFLLTCQNKDKLDLVRVRKAVGIMQYISYGFRVGRAHIAPLIALRTTLEGMLARRGGSPAKLFGKVDARVHEAVNFFVSMFEGWDGLCPILMGFGPCAPIEARGWHDASTTHGRVGGLLLIESTQQLIGFSRKFSDKDKRSLRERERQSKALRIGKMSHREREERAEASRKRKREGAGDDDETAPSSPAHELIGQRIWLQMCGGRCARLRLLLEGDCRPAVQAFKKAFSSKSDMMAPLRASRILTARHNLCLRVCHVRREWGPLQIADLLSRNEVEKARCLAKDIFGLDLSFI